MITWTNKIKQLQKHIETQKKAVYWLVKYLSDYRVINFKGDGILFFRGIISLDGKSIYIAKVHGPKHDPQRYFDNSVVFENGKYPDPNIYITIKQFYYYIDKKMNQYG